MVEGEDERGGVGDGSVGEDDIVEEWLEGVFEGGELFAVHVVLFGDGLGAVGGGGGVGAVEGDAAVELEDPVHEEVPATLGGVEIGERRGDAQMPDFVDVPV